MDCLEFRNQYLAFADQTLPPEAQSAADMHLASCSICARHDLAMRRGLLVLRNLPSVEPSSDFYVRLTTIALQQAIHGYQLKQTGKLNAMKVPPVVMANIEYISGHLPQLMQAMGGPGRGLPAQH